MLNWISALLLSASIGLVLPGATSAQGLTTEMDRMFDTLSNPTYGGYYDSQSRGEISGGGLYVRSRIVNANLFHIQPPSFRAGCGGLDFFAGSFSFINREQFIQLMRAVAANAAGYAFNIAMKTICEDCMVAIETLIRKINELNRHMGNSCQLAQGLVNDTLSAATGQKYGEASLVSVFEGFSDTFDSFTTSDGQSPTQSLATNAPDAFEASVTGNLVWRALVQAGADAWLDGDRELMEVMMNITGTVIVNVPAVASDPGEIELTVIQPNPKIIEGMLTGDPVTIQRCVGTGADQCLQLTPGTISFPEGGFRDRVFNQLIDTSEGIIAGIRGSATGVPVATTQSFVGALPGGAGALLVRLSAVSEQAAGTFADVASMQIAIELTRQVMDGLHHAVRAATSGLTDAYASRVEELIAESQRRTVGELGRLTGVHGNVFELVNAYSRYLDVLPAGPYATPAGARIALSK